MGYNLANLDELKRHKINVDLAAAAIAFQERHKIPIKAEQVGQEQPKELRSYFRTRVAYYRIISLSLIKPS